MRRPNIDTNTVWILLLSLALGIIIWADGVRDSDPLDTRQFTLPLTVVDKTNAVVINSLPSLIQIDVEAPSTVLNAINPSVFDAVIDLTTADFGGSTVPVQVQYDTAVYPQLRIISRFPEETTVEIDQQIEKTIPVAVELRGSAAEGFSLEQSVANPSDVVLTGPSTRVNEIVEVRTDVFLDSPRDTVTRNRPLSFYDAQGNAVLLSREPIVNTSSTSVFVTIPVVERPGYKTVLVRPNLLGNPNDNFLRAGVEVNPILITINGAPELIADLVSVQTTEINIDGLRASQSYNVDVILPDGVERVRQDRIEVDVDILPIEEPRTFRLTPQTVGLDEAEFAAELEQETIEVVLFGPRELLNTISPEEIPVTLDMSGLEVGIHEIAVAVDVPIQDVTVSSVQPEVLVVELVSLRPTATPTATPTRTPRPTATPTIDPDATATVTVTVTATATP